MFYMTTAIETRSSLEQVHDYLTGAAKALSAEAVQNILWDGHCAGRNTFLLSLHDQAVRGRRLSDKQLAAAVKVAELRRYVRQMVGGQEALKRRLGVA